MTRTISARKLALLLLLAAREASGRRVAPMVGVTRVQKLLFLVFKRLPKIAPTRLLKVDFNYVPEKYGPADVALYADLEFLVTLGLIRRGSVASVSAVEAPASHADDQAGQLELDPVLFRGSEPSPVGPAEEPSLEEATEDDLSFEYLMGDEEPAADLAAGERKEDAFAITERGLKVLRDIELFLDAPGKRAYGQMQQACADVRAQFGTWPLQKLLNHVYSQYHDMTTASEIRDRVLGQQRR